MPLPVGRNRGPHAGQQNSASRVIEAVTLGLFSGVTAMKTGIFKFVTCIGIVLLSAVASLGYSADSQRDTRYSEAELDQMLAPVALYPDVLLSQVLMAATYPLEVVEAQRWVTQNPGLEGDAAVDAVAERDWDPSVKALVAFPQVLARMDDDLRWTQAVGDAYLGQEEDVVEAIQRLRDNAYAQGTLEPTEHTRVYREREIVYIEPVSTNIIHVPYYSTRHVYSNWWWPDYPPHYWGPPVGATLGPRFYWGSGIQVAPRFFFSAFHWHNRHIVLVDRHNYLNHYPRLNHLDQRYVGHQRWYHNPLHRRGVLYPRYYEPPHHSFIRNSDRRYYDGWSRDSYYPWRDQQRHRNDWQRQNPDTNWRRDDSSRNRFENDRRHDRPAEGIRHGQEQRQWVGRDNRADFRSGHQQPQRVLTTSQRDQTAQRAITPRGDIRRDTTIAHPRAGTSAGAASAANKTTISHPRADRRQTFHRSATQELRRLNAPRREGPIAARMEQRRAAEPRGQSMTHRASNARQYRAAGAERAGFRAAGSQRADRPQRSANGFAAR